ncbi:MAG: hypothetical protein LKG11_03335 [Bacilli bacterium]|jgi:ribosome biogenesis GTPase A|nr:hypothetical protein [Bacilli bacterium]
MSKVNVVRRCYSCGAILQSGRKDKEGYIDPELLTHPLSEVLFCSRCYSEAHFNLLPLEPKVSADFLLMLDDAAASDALIVYVVDVISFESSFSRAIAERIKSLRILVLANKRDLMPKETKDEDIEEYVAHRFRVASLPVEKNQVITVSLTTLANVQGVAQRIESERKGHDVYIIGPNGSGKSLFFTAFLRNYLNASNHNITTSVYPGTSLRLMQIPLDNSSFLYDTPGTSIKNAVVGVVEPECARQIIPTTPLKERKFAMRKGGALFIGGLAHIELIDPGLAKDGEVGIRAYFGDGVSLRKIAAPGDIAESFRKRLEKGGLAPTTHLIRDQRDFDVFDFKVEEEGSRDLGIAGLGWINFKGAKETFRVYVPKGVSVYGSRCKVK